MRATAKLFTTKVKVQCPFCFSIVRKEGGGDEFGPEELEAGTSIKCDKDGCKMEFRIPTGMKAIVGEPVVAGGYAESRLARHVQEDGARA